MILVGSSSNASGHRRIYVRQEVRKAFPLERSPSKSGGRDGLREIFFRPAVEVGIVEGARRVGSRRDGKAGLTGFDMYSSVGWRLTGRRVGDAGLIAAGPNLCRMSCSTLWFASASLLISSIACSRVEMRFG